MEITSYLVMVDVIQFFGFNWCKKQRDSGGDCVPTIAFSDKGEGERERDWGCAGGRV